MIEPSFFAWGFVLGVILMFVVCRALDRRALERARKRNEEVARAGWQAYAEGMIELERARAHAADIAPPSPRPRLRVIAGDRDKTPPDASS